jgi:hypothetical protein
MTKERRNKAMADAAPLKLNDFSSYLNTDFHARTPDGHIVSLKLVQAACPHPADVFEPLREPGLHVIPLPKALAKAVASAKSEVRDGGPFSLQFAGPRNFQGPPGTYMLNHPKLGRLDVFLVPAGQLPNDGGYGYNASFS